MKYSFVSSFHGLCSFVGLNVRGKRRVLLAGVLFSFLSGIPAQAAPKGIIIYSEHAISDPTILEFEKISWKDGYGGQIVHTNGNAESFINTWCKKIVYFDPAYYQAIDSVTTTQPMRAHIKVREVVIESDPKELTTSEEANRLHQNIATLGGVQKDFPVSNGILGPISKSLSQQLDRFNRGEQKHEGRWLTASEAGELKAKRDAEALRQAKEKSDAQRVAKEPARMKFTFSTNGGKTYYGVTLSAVDKTGFTIVVAQGVVRVGFDELLEDLSDLPPEVSDRVQEIRDAAKQRAKEEEAARKRAEEERITKEKEEQHRGALAQKKLGAAEQPPAPSQRVEASSSTQASAAAREAEQRPLAAAGQAEVERAQAIAQAAEAERSKAAAAKAKMQAPVDAKDQPQQPGFYISSNQTAIEVSALTPILIIGIYMARFKSHLAWNRRLAIFLCLYICALGIGFALELFLFQQFDNGPTSILCFGLALGTIPPLVCCILTEGVSRIFRKPEPAEQVVTPDPELASTYVASGITKFNKGDYSGTIADCIKAICLDPNMAAAYSVRGNAKNDMGDLKEALADYDMAIQLDPSCAVNYYNRANTKHEMGENGKAAADYGRAIELDPTIDQFYNNRGVAFLGMADFDKAIADFTRAIDLNPLYASAYVNRGSAHSQKGETDEALADFQKALEANPSLDSELKPQIQALLAMKEQQVTTSE